jgi:hypothetical protein
MPIGSGSAWDTLSVFSQTGLVQASPMSAKSTTTPGVGRSAITPQEGLLHPHNALFWFGVLAAATFGLMAFSVQGRVLSAKGGVSVGSNS